MRAMILCLFLVGCGSEPFSGLVSGGDGALGSDSGIGGDGGATSSEDAGGSVGGIPGSDDSGSTAPCLTDLSGVGTADFRIAFTLTTTNVTQTLALASQRTGCDQSSVWWQAIVDSAGGIVFETCNGPGAHAGVEAGNAINDGRPHRIVLARVAGAISYSYDGVIGSAVVPDAYSFGTFGAPLTIGTDTCGDTPFAGHGALTDLCVTIK